MTAAAIAGDQDALARLFGQAQELFGDQASPSGSEAISGLDASCADAGSRSGGADREAVQEAQKFSSPVFTWAV